MRQVFISYARNDREAVEALAARLRRLVDSVWFDSQLHGGEDWWVGILERIRGSDVFLAVVSSASLDSEACRIERTYARETNRTILPVALEEIPPALPSDLATVQIVDFSSPGEDAVADLARALLATPTSIPLPDPLPDEPAAPLSYLTTLVDRVTSPDELTKSEQVEIVTQLERGLEASDPDEREGARQVLARMAERDDLASSVEKTIVMLRREHLSTSSGSGATSTRSEGAARGVSPSGATVAGMAGAATAASSGAGRTAGASPDRSASVPSTTDVTHMAATTTTSDDEPNRRRPWVAAVVLAVLAAVVGGVWVSLSGTSTDEPVAEPRIEVEGDDPDEPDPPPEEPDPPVDPDPPPGDPCANPPGSFPGEVAHPTSSDAALQWQWILVRQGVFRDDPANCNGEYTGPLQKQAVMDVRISLGLDPADGLLDEELYLCLTSDEGCPAPPCVVPDVRGLTEDAAVAALVESGFEPRVEVEELGDPFDVVRDQGPGPGGEHPCGDIVVIVFSGLL